MIPGFNRFARNLRGGGARAARYWIYDDVLPGTAIGCAGDRALAISGSLGHEWNGAMAMNGIGLWPWMECAMAMNGIGP